MAVYKSKEATKDGRTYYFRIKYKDIFGKTIDYSSKKFISKKEAIDEEALYRVNIKQNDISTNTITINDIYNEYYQKKSRTVKKQTLIKISELYKHLDPIKNCKINDINVAKYNQFFHYIENKNFSTKHSNKILGLFKALITYSNKYYNTSNAILKFIDPFKNANQINSEMDFFTYDEYIKFQKVIDDEIWKTWFNMLYYLGLRCGECQALQFKDIDFEKSTISINKTLTTKIKGEKWTISTPKTKNSIRVLPLPKKLLNELKTIKNNAMIYNDFKYNWFIFGNGIPFKENTIQHRKNKYCKLAELKQIRIHDFRHSCASFLINYCHATISLVSKYLGHSTVALTLNTYTHMYKSELDEIAKLIDNL